MTNQLNMTEKCIIERLKQIERENSVRILLAVESGCRAWGVASPDSDRDVRFIYVHPVEWYLTVEPGGDVIEVMDGVFDACGWELRKALRLYRKTNSSMLEWLRSPIRYIDDNVLAATLLKYSCQDSQCSSHDRGAELDRLLYEMVMNANRTFAKSEDYYASSRNGHKLVDFFNREANTLDIRSNGMYPSNVLSNLCSNSFRIDGILCGSMEGFLQSLKRPDKERQRQICGMKGGNARKKSVASWQTDQVIWWDGMAFDRHDEAYQLLLRRAYRAMFDQNERFRAALMATRGITLIHTIGEQDPYKTIITPDEFCSILTEIRESYDKRDKNL